MLYPPDLAHSSVSFSLLPYCQISGPAAKFLEKPWSLCAGQDAESWHAGLDEGGTGPQFLCVGVGGHMARLLGSNPNMWKVGEGSARPTDWPHTIYLACRAKRLNTPDIEQACQIHLPPLGRMSGSGPVYGLNEWHVAAPVGQMRHMESSPGSWTSCGRDYMQHLSQLQTRGQHQQMYISRIIVMCFT